jgi:hypothetical protein
VRAHRLSDLSRVKPFERHRLSLAQHTACNKYVDKCAKDAAKLAAVAPTNALGHVMRRQVDRKHILHITCQLAQWPVSKFGCAMSSNIHTQEQAHVGHEFVFCDVAKLWFCAICLVACRRKARTLALDRCACRP